MDTLYTMRQGETKKLDIVVLDETGQGIDLSTSGTTNIVVSLSNKNQIFAKYSLVDMGVGFGDLSVNNNIISLITTREETKNWATGICSATITFEQDDLVLTHLVEDFEIQEFLTINSSLNKDYTLIHS